MSSSSSSTPRGGSGGIPKDDEGLAKWGSTPPKETRPVQPRKRRRGVRVVLGVVLLFVVVVGVLIGFAPSIASAVAPGYIEAAAKESIKGSVKVKALSLSWGGPTTVGPVELYDDKGKLVGEVAATLAPGLWKIVSEQWWSQKNLDVGQVEVTGKLDVVKESEETNLQRAVAPAKPSAPKPSKGGGMPFDSLKGTLRLTGLDVTFTDKTPAAAGTPMAAGVGVTKFGGDVKVNYDAKGGGATAKADLSGGLKGAGSGADKITLTADVDLKQDAKGGLEKIDAKVDVLGAPLDLVDGLAGFGGELVKSIGPRADVHVQVNGNPDKATATIGALAEGASADVALEYAGGVLKTTKPGTVKLRSTDFVAGMPGMKEKVKELGTKVRLDAGPSVEVTIASLALPIPKSALGLEAPAAGKSSKVDLRGGSVDVTVAVGAQHGQVNTGGLSGGSGKDGFKPFAVEPLTLRLNAPTLEGAKRVTAATKATVDGKPAGELAVDLSVTGLLNAQGQFDMAALTKAEGEAKLLGVTTALLQPIVDAAGVKVDMAQDVGPTLDVVVKPSTNGAPAGGQLPATDLNLAITSANIKGGGDVRYDNGKVSTLGNGVVIDVASAGALAGRMMGAPAPGEPAMISGKLPIRVSLRDVLLDMDKKSLGDIKATAEVRVSDGVVSLPEAKAEAGQPAPAPLGPIALNNAVVTAVLAPGSPAAVGIDAALGHEGKPFTVTGNFTAAGLGAPAAPDTAKKGPIEQLLALKLGGRLDVKDVPRTLAKISPGAYQGLLPTGNDGASEIKKLIWREIGESVSLALTTEAAEGAQRTKIDIAGAALSATTTASVTPSEVSVSVLSAQASLSPGNVAPVLAAFTPKGTAKDDKPAPAVMPMALDQAVTVMLNAEPLRVPFKPGTTSPDLAAIKEAVVKLTTDKPVLVSNIAAKDGKGEAAGLMNLVATARAPGAYFGEASAGTPAALSAKVTADVVRPAQGSAWTGSAANAVVCAKADIDATLPKDAAAEQSFGVKLTDVNSAALSPLTGDPLLLPGTLGDKVQITANAKLSGDAKSGQKIAFQADIEAPRLKGASLRGSTQGDVMKVDAARMAWTPSVAWVNSAVFASKDGTPTDQLAQEATFTIDVKSLAAATSKTDDKGNAVQGPMKPGVFNADVSVTSPSAVIKRADGKTVQAEEISVALKGGQKAGTVTLDATIGRVSGEGATSTKASMLHATVDNLADERGVLTTDKAVVNASGDLQSFPTPLIDSLAKQNGRIVDFLGNTLDLKLTAQNVSKTKEGGVIQATASSPRAAAQLGGVIQNQTFVQQGKFEVDVYELVKYEIAKKLPGGMPLVGFIEKKKGTDEPGQIKAEGLRVPLDNDMRKLNGVITVDPGTATFEFNDAFSKILKQLSQKDKGQVGRRLDPFVVNIKDGVASYDKYKLKFGEFTLETTGVADLVQKKIDVVTYVPAGAVTEEILNLFKGTLGKNAKGFTADTRFPFTTKGPLENPKTEPDFGLFIKENAGNLLQDVGGKAIEDLLKKLNKGK